MIIPVLDIKNGIAVSGKSGMRKTYKPLKTVFHHSHHPLLIAKALKNAGADSLYIADLDVIEGIGSNRGIVKEINKIIPVMLDPGVGDVNDVKIALKVTDKVIVATETLKNLSDLDEIFGTFSGEKLVVSIDIKDGQIFSQNIDLSFSAVIRKLRELKPDKIILLDISGVGTLKGFDLNLLDKFKGLEGSLILGGGITQENMVDLKQRGIKKFLVGSALHSGDMASCPIQNIDSI